ncbi:TPA: hypothetical protein DEB02_04520 [Candidatus Beckwithbacteria bacterium]|nr:hypothetical protein [Candidatus Beckwithbacteria bacterium]
MENEAGPLSRGGGGVFLPRPKNLVLFGRPPPKPLPPPHPPPPPPPVQCSPDPRHYILVQEGKIVIGEYDGTNQDTVYAGPFSDDFAYPWPNGSRLIILASLNGGSNQPPNLYSINLK